LPFAEIARVVQITGKGLPALVLRYL